MRLFSRRTSVVTACLAAVIAAGCQTLPAAPAGDESPDPVESHAVAPDGSPITKVLVVIEENHTLDQMRDGMPYLASLAEQYGYATRWTALTHPSEPNYLAIGGGSTFGVTDDASPKANASKVGDAPSIFGLAISAGRTVRTYAESMPQNCHVWDHPDKSIGTPTYAVRHNPWVYFPNERDQCLRYDLDLSTFAADAANDALPNVGLLIPDLTHDAHDGSLGQADAWLRDQLAPVLASDDFTSGRLAVVVTADEDDRSQDNTVLTTVLHVDLSHVVVDTPLTHYSLTRFLADVASIRPPGNAIDAADMMVAFGL